MEVKDNTTEIQLDKAIEKILVESGLSLSAFSRKVGYSRQYIYELLKPEKEGASRKIQLDTLKKICDATGYGLRRLLTELGYIPNSMDDSLPNTIITVDKNGVKRAYVLEERDAILVREMVASLARTSDK